MIRAGRRRESRGKSGGAFFSGDFKDFARCNLITAEGIFWFVNVNIKRGQSLKLMGLFYFRIVRKILLERGSW